MRALVPPERWHHVDAAHHWQIDSQLGWVQRANLDSYSLDSLTSEPIPLATNGDGLLPATATRERPADSARILLVGDSTIVGVGVAESQRIHQVLADELNGRGLRVDVVNAGTNGYSTDQTLLRLEQLIEPYAPDLVLHCITANDFVANTLDRNHGINKPSFRIDATGTLSANAFSPSDQVRNPRWSPASLIQRSAVYRLLQPRLVVLRARLGGWESRNLIGMADDWYYDADALERVDWLLFGALVERMQQVSHANGAAFAVYLHPDIGAVWDPMIEDARSRGGGGATYERFALERRVSLELARGEVPFLPLVDYFVARQERGPFHLLPRDPHCNATGYRMQAERLAERIQAAALLSPSLPDSDRSAP